MEDIVSLVDASGEALAELQIFVSLLWSKWLSEEDDGEHTTGSLMGTTDHSDKGQRTRVNNQPEFVNMINHAGRGTPRKRTTRSS